MPDTIETGVFTSGMLPQSYRNFYEQQLLDVLRRDTIFTKMAIPKEDFAARGTKTIYFTKAYDLHPAIGALTEGVPFIQGAYLDSEQTYMTVREHGNTIKTNEFHEKTSFWQGPDFLAFVRERLGRNLVESAEIMCRNEFLTTTHLDYPNGVAARGDLTATDIFSVDLADLSRTGLQSRDAIALNAGDAPVCIIHPRVGRDIRKAAGSEWKEAQLYAGAVPILRGEIGMFSGVRYVQNNFCKLPNAGATAVQTTVDASGTSGATLVGQGGPNSAAQTPALLEYITVADTTGFSVGMEITVHTASLGTAVLETDALAEHRVIREVTSGTRLKLTKPLYVAHATGAYVTEARDLYGSFIIAGPGMVLGVAQNPEVRIPPQIDDFMRIHRISWYGIFDYSLLQDDYVECWISAASTADYGDA